MKILPDKTPQKPHSLCQKSRLAKIKQTVVQLTDCIEELKKALEALDGLLIRLATLAFLVSSIAQLLQVH